MVSKIPETKDITITVVSILGNLMEITSWQFPYLEIEMETSIKMFPTFPRCRKPEEPVGRQFPCLGNDIDTSTQISKLLYKWEA